MFSFNDEFDRLKNEKKEELDRLKIENKKLKEKISYKFIEDWQSNRNYSNTQSFKTQTIHERIHRLKKQNEFFKDEANWDCMWDLYLHFHFIYLYFREKNCLGQSFEKKHLDPENNLTEKEWDTFITYFQNGFTQEATGIAHECFQNFLEEKKELVKKAYGTEDEEEEDK